MATANLTNLSKCTSWSSASCMTASSKVTRQHITFTLSFHSYMHMHKDTHIDICSDGSSLPCRVAIFPSATWQWFWPLQWQMCPPHLPALWHKCHSSGQSASSTGLPSRQTGRSGTWQWRTTCGREGRGGSQNEVRQDGWGTPACLCTHW